MIMKCAALRYYARVERSIMAISRCLVVITCKWMFFDTQSSDEYDNIVRIKH